MTREQFIAGLREAADYLDAHPELPGEAFPLTVNQFVQTKEELAAFARMGGWEKHANGDYFWLHRNIGSLSYELNIHRDKICRRIVTGTTVVPEQVVETVEWICDEPLLAASGAQQGDR